MEVQNIERSLLDDQSIVFAIKQYKVRISNEVVDKQWDRFLERTPYGHHVQTSLWAQIKSSLGWQSVRIIITKNEKIVAGAQILFRSIPLLGNVGFVSKGPLLAIHDDELENFVVAELQRLVRQFRIQHLIVQPPGSENKFENNFSEHNFLPSSTEVAPPATLLIDLSKDEETIMSEMSAKTRYNVRLSGRRGITIREGTEQDLDIYYSILKATGERQNFSPYPKKYFTEMWRVFHPTGHIRLTVAEFENQFVSAQLAVPFGDTVINKLSVWSGDHGSHRPNEALQWESIQWAKRNRYRYYDFEGIKPSAVPTVQNGKPLPESLKQSVTSYKLGFGGQAVLFSKPYVYLYNPLYRWAFNNLYPKLKDLKFVKKMRKQLRTS
jgi:lipid II:glycine glycyltransferase (peptidoglycan interpeptide bridge formation enzyme)